MSEEAPGYPQPDDSPLWQPFWQQVNDGKLSYMRCDACAHAFLPPRAECPNCLRPGPRWAVASGKAKLVSWVVYHTVVDPVFKERLPYTVAIVELAEGPRMTTNIVGIADPETLSIDQQLELRIEQEATTAVPRFIPVAA